MVVNVEWKHREEYMRERHAITVTEANEALDDPDAVWYDPDPKSTSGVSVRVIGYSHTAHAVLTVILLPFDDRTGFYGVNGWKSNPADRRIYQEGVTEL